MTIESRPSAARMGTVGGRDGRVGFERRSPEMASAMGRFPTHLL